MALRIETGSRDRRIVSLERDLGRQSEREPNRRQQGIIGPVVTSDYSAKVDEFIRVDPTDGALTITLPRALTRFVGESILIGNFTGSTNWINVDARPSTISGSGNLIMNAGYELIEFIIAYEDVWLWR